MSKFTFFFWDKVSGYDVDKKTSAEDISMRIHDETGKIIYDGPIPKKRLTIETNIITVKADEPS